MIRFSFINFSMASKNCVFIIILKREVCRSKVSLESGSKTHEPNVPSCLGYNNFIWSHLKELQKLTHNLVAMSILSSWSKNLHFNLMTNKWHAILYRAFTTLIVVLKSSQIFAKWTLVRGSIDWTIWYCPMHKVGS